MLRTVLLLLLTLLLVPLSVLYFDVPLTDLQNTALHTLLTVWAIAVTWCFVTGELTNNVSQVDKLWSIMPVIYVWIMAYYGGWQLRFLAMAILVTIWGIRLSYNFWRRGGYSLIPWKGTEDYRWEILRSRAPLNKRLAWTLFHLFFITLYQQSLILLFCQPMLLALENPDGPLQWYEVLPLACMLGFIILETVADQQQYNFQTEKYRRLVDKKDPGPYASGFVDTGLWSLCRHPNYAAEQLVWVSFYFCSVAATGRLLNWSVSGCILLMLLFLGSSDFSEKISASKYPGYAGYMASKPRFWPAFVKK
jgi:steroid 5-alpha reductase family enzyme